MTEEWILLTDVFWEGVAGRPWSGGHWVEWVEVGHPVLEGNNIVAIDVGSHLFENIKRHILKVNFPANWHVKSPRLSFVNILSRI